MIKRNILSVLISTFLATGTANAVEIYNKDGSQLDLYGMVDARHLFSDNKSESGDRSYVRFGLKGQTEISDQLTGYGQVEKELEANKPESKNDEKLRLAFVGVKFADLGSVDYGRNYGVLYDVNIWTDVLPTSGGDSFFRPDNYMTARSSGLATYRNTNFFGMVDGLNFALQYQGANQDGREGIENIKTQNGEGVGVSTTYDVGYGIKLGAAYSAANRTAEQKELSDTHGNKAQAWNIGAKYDADNLYLAAMYAETQNLTPYGKRKEAIAKQTKNVEVVAQYQLDFGLRPSLAYVQSKGSNDMGSEYLLKYVSVGSFYNFNKNVTAYVDYKINLLNENEFTKVSGINTKDVVGVGVVYKF